MNIDVTQIILAVITLIGAVLTGFLIPLLKAKLLSEDAKLNGMEQDLLRLAITTAVTAAEQIYNSEEGQKKKAYVLGLLEAQGYPADSAAIDAAVEAICLEIHKQLKE